jgi:predicted nucleotidyltransferase
VLTTSTPAPWTIPQALQGELALGRGIDAEALCKGLEGWRSVWTCKALVVLGSRACAGTRPDSAIDLLVIGTEAGISPEEQIERRQELRTVLAEVGVAVDPLV